jgi:C-terminal processing protease CtpA/Prc
LRRLVAALHDGHGVVYKGNRAERAGFPFAVDWIEGEVVITFSDDGWYEVGDVVERINGVEAKKLLQSDEELISGSPQWKRHRSLRAFGWGEYGSVVSLEVKRNGKIVEINAGRLAKKPLQEVPKPNPVEEIEPGVYYVNLSIATMESIQKHVKDIAAAKGVVFDLRGYPNSNHLVISHLLTAPDTSSAWMQVPEIIYPDGENRAGWTRHGWHMTPLTPHIEGKVAFITDGRAISYAESFMGLVEHYKLGEIVGQPTAGTNGNANPFSLPGGYRVMWTGMRVVKHDGSRHHLVGILPTVPAERTIQGVLDGRDEFLEKALEVVRPVSED